MISISRKFEILKEILFFSKMFRNKEFHFSKRISKKKKKFKGSQKKLMDFPFEEEIQV